MHACEVAASDAGRVQHSVLSIACLCLPLRGLPSTLLLVFWRRWIIDAFASMAHVGRFCFS